MTIDEFRHAMSYTSKKSTAEELREARRLARKIINENRVLFDKLAKL